MTSVLRLRSRAYWLSEMIFSPTLSSTFLPSSTIMPTTLFRSFSWLSISWLTNFLSSSTWCVWFSSLVATISSSRTASSILEPFSTSSADLTASVPLASCSRTVSTCACSETE